jgi:uncharacterized protein with HEPN domain
MRLDHERLLDILEAIEAIERYRPTTREEFDRNELVRVWCLRHLEIIGEAAATLSQETRDKTPAIPWRQIIGMRNVLIHAYFDVDWNAIWNVVKSDLPPLQAGVRLVLAIIGENPIDRAQDVPDRHP